MIVVTFFLWLIASVCHITSRRPISGEFYTIDQYFNNAFDVSVLQRYFDSEVLSQDMHSINDHKHRGIILALLDLELAGESLDLLGLQSSLLVCHLLQLFVQPQNLWAFLGNFLLFVFQFYFLKMEIAKFFGKFLNFFTKGQLGIVHFLNGLLQRGDRLFLVCHL
jgi:hypothetical protein